MDNCERCGKTQTNQAYCVKWKENDCIRMESIINSQSLKGSALIGSL